MRRSKSVAALVALAFLVAEEDSVPERELDELGQTMLGEDAWAELVTHALSLDTSDPEAIIATFRRLLELP